MIDVPGKGVMHICIVFGHREYPQDVDNSIGLIRKEIRTPRLMSRIRVIMSTNISDQDREPVLDLQAGMAL